ncbi:glycosyltransferase family 87 protein [Nonomuraea angiospora]|uniref:glycosyltransferase family 87 protein n=1 Tax=Nonomuraea angiospora TaxID=46172 RepID=UPI0029A73043|nr:glycosyltransferase family 87 protein [Nonomuraea angiospora]MDX3106554.1 glycosyltransferase family 87 protein [Nonomuraea angiospora]
MTCRAAGTVVLLAALAGTLALAIGADTVPADRHGLFWPYALAWAFFCAAAWAVRGLPARQARCLVIAGGIAVTATGLLSPPATSTDSYRYAWDGRVQAAGVSPYDRAPAEAALAPLRDPWLFPRGAGCEGPDRYPIPSGDSGTSCTRINRPGVHTIYPPLAEAYFLLVHGLSPEGARHKPLQVGGALLACATSAVLLIALSRRPGTRDDAPAYAACYAWCPAVPLELVNNAHVDALGILLAVLALTTVNRHRVLGGALLGAATAVKLLPAATVPGALSGILASGGKPPARRMVDALAVLGPAALVVALAYLPYVLASRGSVLGYFFGYLTEEGYEDAGSGDRYALLRLVLPGSWAFPAALVILGITIFHVLRHGDADRPWRGALLVTGVGFLVFTPGYSWYAVLVVALVALDGRWEWLGVPLASGVAYMGTVAGSGTIAYALAALAVAAGLVVRAVRPSSGSAYGHCRMGARAWLWKNRFR